MKQFAGALLAVGLVLFFWTAAHPYPGTAPEGARKQPGFSPYKQYCARCHGLGGRSKRSSKIAGKPVSLVRADFKQDITRTRIERMIVEGKGEMDGLGSKLDPTQLKNIVDFVLWLPSEAVSTAVDSLAKPR